LFEGIDQIDLTGPFEVLSRIPNSAYRIYGKTAAPVRDLKGLRLTVDRRSSAQLWLCKQPTTSSVRSMTGSTGIWRAIFRFRPLPIRPG
jgi:hypothetical protein